jgi:hypothetical protein
MLRIMITKIMMTKTPMMVPIIPLFMARPPLVLLRYPRTRTVNRGRGRLTLRPRVDCFIRGVFCITFDIYRQMPQLRIGKGDSCGE